VIDLHTHILPGLDDGARTLEESVAMARSAVADGIRVMAATPHVREDYPTRAAEMERGVGDLRQALAKGGFRCGRGAFSVWPEPRTSSSAAR